MDIATSDASDEAQGTYCAEEVAEDA